MSCAKRISSGAKRATKPMRSNTHARNRDVPVQFVGLLFSARFRKMAQGPTNNPPTPRRKNDEGRRPEPRRQQSKATAPMLERPTDRPTRKHLVSNVDFPDQPSTALLAGFGADGSQSLSGYQKQEMRYSCLVGGPTTCREYGATVRTHTGNQANRGSYCSASVTAPVARGIDHLLLAVTGALLQEHLDREAVHHLVVVQVVNDEQMIQPSPG